MNIQQVLKLLIFTILLGCSAASNQANNNNGDAGYYNQESSDDATDAESDIDSNGDEDTESNTDEDGESNTGGETESNDDDNTESDNDNAESSDDNTESESDNGDSEEDSSESNSDEDIESEDNTAESDDDTESESDDTGSDTEEDTESDTDEESNTDTDEETPTDTNEDTNNSTDTVEDTGSLPDTSVTYDNLHQAATAAGKFIGTAVNAGMLSGGGQYTTILAEEFEHVTPENCGKWEPLEPSDNNYNWGDFDSIVNFAEDNGQIVKGHTFVWHRQHPSWLNALSASALNTAIKTHIETTMDRYQGRVRAWDVVNEAVDTATSSGYTESVFYNTLGSGYIADAFRWARDADPHALLFYNEVGIERMGAKSDFTYELVKDLLAQGVPIDGIGFQCHVSTHRYPSLDDLRANIRRFADLGLIVNISEVDARTTLMPGTQEEQWHAQRIAFQQLAGACIAEPGCEGITLWGFYDGHSWINDDGTEYALIYDRSYQKKPSYDGTMDGLKGMLPVEGDNQLENGDFTDGNTGWSASGGVLTVDAANGRDGQAACVTQRGEERDGPVQDNLASKLGDGGPHSVSAWIRLTGNSQPETVAVTLIVNGGSEELNLAERPIAAGEWVSLTGYVGLGYSNTPNDISLEISGPSSGVDLCVTDVALKPLSTH